MGELAADQVAAWVKGTWEGQPPETFSGVSIDTRTLQSGELYIAIEGDRFDGHDFIQAALDCGAGGVLAATGKGLEVKGPVLRVKNTREALKEVAGGYRATLPLEETIGITGSVGKTTVKEMTAAILSAHGPTAKTLGNWNNDLGVPLSLLAAPNRSRYGVFEVGMNHPGELAPLCKLLQPTWGILTTVGMAHSEFFKTEEDIALEKASLFKSLHPKGGGVLSKENPWFDLLAKSSAARVVTVSHQVDADYQAREIQTARGGFRVVEKETGDEVDIALPQPGLFMVENALLAIALGRQLGVPWEDVQGALGAYTHPPMRWQCESANGVTFINDAYNANPLSMRAALDTFADLPGDGQKWIVLGGMFELGKEEENEHLRLGSYIAGGPWAGLLTLGRLGQHIAGAAHAAGKGLKVVSFADHADVSTWLQKHVQPGDRVLLKASRGEQVEQVFNHWKEKGP